MREGQELSRAISLNEKDQGVQALGLCLYELEYDIGVDEETARPASDCPIVYTTKAPFPTKESIKKFRASPQGLKWKRKNEPRGPLAVFGYDYFADHAKAAGIETPKLLSYEGLWGGAKSTLTRF
jgi:hypothetical protein